MKKFPIILFSIDFIGYAGYILYNWLLPPKDVFEENVKKMAKHDETAITINEKKQVKVIRINGKHCVLRKSGDDLDYPVDMTGITYKKDFMVTRYKDGKYYAYDVQDNRIIKLDGDAVKQYLKQHDLDPNFDNLE